MKLNNYQIAGIVVVLLLIIYVYIVWYKKRKSKKTKKTKKKKKRKSRRKPIQSDIDYDDEEDEDYEEGDGGGAEDISENDSSDIYNRVHNKMASKEMELDEFKDVTDDILGDDSAEIYVAISELYDEKDPRTITEDDYAEIIKQNS